MYKKKKKNSIKICIIKKRELIDIEELKEELEEIKDKEDNNE